jgi:hypothetical protein
MCSRMTGNTFKEGEIKILGREGGEEGHVGWIVVSWQRCGAGTIFCGSSSDLSESFSSSPAPAPAINAIRYFMSQNLHTPTCCCVRPCPCWSIIHWGYQQNWLLGRFKNSQPIAGSRSRKLNPDYGSGFGKSSGSATLWAGTTVRPETNAVCVHTLNALLDVQHL